MTKCIILRGLPALGKSTWANVQGLPIINKDTIRLENPGIKEEEVRKIQKTSLENLFKSGMDCILDNTHMYPGSLERAINECEEIGFEVEIKDFMTGVPFNRRRDALYQNKNREARVPQSVIDKMYLSQYKVSDSTFFRDVFIFDLDGTLANLEHRLHYVKTEGQKKDWKSFFAECGKDTVIKPVSKVWHALSSPTTCKMIVSGRSSECAFDTEERLEKNGFKYDFILMRDSRDKRDDYDVKKEIYEKFLKNNNILGVFDDRARVVKARQELGVFTFDVGQGKIY